MADETTLALASRIYGLLDARATYNGDQFIAETARLIYEDRAAVREAALREAIEVVERWTWGTVNEMDTGKKRTLEALEKLLTEKRTP
jgi:hypothetical protein